MILFETDWERYPNAQPDYSTSNTSFIKLAAKYKKMGVRNYEFLLALHQPELKGVDPHSPYLSVETMAKIGLECYRNPWYFFREVVRIPPQGSSTPGPFIANRGNIALYWLFFNHVDPVLIQPRQTGKSVSTDCLMLYLLLIGSVNTRISMLTKDDELRRENVERMKSIRSYLPEYLQAITSKDSNNSIEVTCYERNNRYGTKVSQNSEAAANNVGRGLTSPVAHVDEGPFVSYIDVSLSAMLASGTAAREEAKRAGMPYGTIFTTTAGKLDTREGRYMFDLFHNGMVWTEELFDCVDEAELHTRVGNGCKKKGAMPIVNITLSHRQLGYTDEWLKAAMAKSNSFGEKADRDFLNRWTSGGLSSPLPTWLNVKIRESEREPAWTEFFPTGYSIRWYVPKEELAARIEMNGCIVGNDSSDAVGRDSITFIFVDPVTLDILGAANMNETMIPRVGVWLADLMIKHTRMTLIPERRGGSAQSILDTVIIQLAARGQDPFRRIYNVVVDESNQYSEEYRQMVSSSYRSEQFYAKMKRHFGFATSGSGRHSRNALYNDNLLRAAKLTCNKCYDKTLIDEITSLVKKNDRIDHTVDGHDDMVIAWLLTVWFLTCSKNLSFYGIEGALSQAEETDINAKVKAKSNDPYDLFVEEQQKAIKQEIEFLLDQIRETSDDILAKRLENRIRTLESRLSDEYNDAVSIDSLIMEARTTRSKRAQDRARGRVGGTGMGRSGPVWRRAA